MMSDPRSLLVMPEVARRAGVSQATVYRHFPDRTALADAVIAYQMSRLEACTGDAARPPAFRTLLREVLHAQVMMRSLVALAHRLDAVTRKRYERRMIAALAGPLRRAQERREVRGDFHARDLALLFGMVEGIVRSSEDPVTAQSAACRSIELILDGLFRCDAPGTGVREIS